MGVPYVGIDNPLFYFNNEFCPSLYLIAIAFIWVGVVTSDVCKFYSLENKFVV